MRKKKDYQSTKATKWKKKGSQKEKKKDKENAKKKLLASKLLHSAVSSNQWRLWENKQTNNYQRKLNKTDKKQNKKQPNINWNLPKQMKPRLGERQKIRQHGRRRRPKEHPPPIPRRRMSSPKSGWRLLMLHGRRRPPLGTVRRETRFGIARQDERQTSFFVSRFSISLRFFDEFRCRWSFGQMWRRNVVITLR